MNGPNLFLLFFLLPFIGYVLALSSFSMNQFLKHLCGANQWTGFYMITASVMKGLILQFQNCEKI